MIAGRTRAPRSIGAANAPASNVSHDPCHMCCAHSNALFLYPLLKDAIDRTGGNLRSRRMKRPIAVRAGGPCTNLEPAPQLADELDRGDLYNPCGSAARDGIK